MGFTEDEVEFNYLYVFLFMSKEIEQALRETSNTNSFLLDEYKDLFIRYYYNNLSELINNDYYNI